MSEPTLFKMLNTQMRYSSQRQGVLAQNIANIDTPNYQASDLKKPDFEKMASGSTSSAPLAMTMATTKKNHLPGVNLSGGTAFKAQESRDTFEISPTGNNVDLEEQMAKVSDTGAEFQIASNMRKKFTSFYRMALGGN
jgi:flagellar basal-body rod protein FlgB